MRETVAWWVFYLCAGMLISVYLEYPAAITLMAWWRRRRPRPSSGSECPSVSILISTRDQAADVRARLEDCFVQHYDGTFEILVGCDGSPQSYEAALEYASRSVRAFNFLRMGKASVQNRLVREAGAEIVLTTDVQTRFAPGFLSEITAPFADPRVGGVTGVMRIGNRDVSATARFEAGYWSYELWLRQQESDAGLLLGVAGAAFAFRRALYHEIGAASDTDNLVPLQLAEQGFRVIQQPTAVVFEEAIETPASELRNRTRSVTRSFADYLRFPRLLNPLRFPGASLWLFSHKLLRFLTPYFALACWGCAFALRRQWIFNWLFFAGLAGLGAAGLGWFAARYRRLPSPWASAVNLLVVNVAFALGTINAIRGKRIAVW